MFERERTDVVVTGAGERLRFVPVILARVTHQVGVTRAADFLVR
jgi:hypothetical protein